MAEVAAGPGSAGTHTAARGLLRLGGSIQLGTAVAVGGYRWLRIVRLVSWALGPGSVGLADPPLRHPGRLRDLGDHGRWQVAGRRQLRPRPDGLQHREPRPGGPAHVVIVQLHGPTGSQGRQPGIRLRPPRTTQALDKLGQRLGQAMPRQVLASSPQLHRRGRLPGVERVGVVALGEPAVGMIGIVLGRPAGGTASRPENLVPSCSSTDTKAPDSPEWPTAGPPRALLPAHRGPSSRPTAGAPPQPRPALATHGRPTDALADRRPGRPTHWPRRRPLVPGIWCRRALPSARRHQIRRNRRWCPDRPLMRIDGP